MASVSGCSGMNAFSTSSRNNYSNENQFGTSSSSIRSNGNSEQLRRCQEGESCLDFATVFQPKWVKLNSVDEGDPVFMFPGIEGRATRFRDLASCLPCPAIGIQYAMDDDCYSSITEIAKCCVKTILEYCQPEQNLSIVGHSFGCAVAHEVVVKLQNSRHENRLKCLVWIEGSSEFVRLFCRHFAGMGPTTDEYPLYLGDEESRTISLYTSLRWLGVTPDLENIIPKLEKLPDFDARCQMTAEAFSKDLQLHVTNRDVANVVQAFVKKLRAAVYHSITKRIKGSVIFFKASIIPARHMAPDYNINKDFDGPVSRYEVPGDHLTVLTGEGCKKITRILRYKLL